MGCIIKGKGKAFSTSYSTFSSGLQSQAVKEQRYLGERLDAKQRKIDTLKMVIAQLIAGQPQPQPQPPPSPLPPPEDAEDLGKD